MSGVVDWDFHGSKEGDGGLGQGTKLHCLHLQHTILFRNSRDLLQFDGISIHYLKNRNCY